ncbi:MAG TPA: hypothetical protein VJX67_16645 [Blastocatellia bacterium]|nr:hypothetical protein [Blastocatellia bacterium]
MQSLNMDFETLFKSCDWKPIRGCPGRYVLAGPASRTSPSQITGPTAIFHVYVVAAAKDPVIAAAISNGGVISFRRPDGFYVHTLNTQSGFERKLRQLGIDSTDFSGDTSLDSEGH